MPQTDMGEIRSLKTCVAEAQGLGGMEAVNKLEQGWRI